MCFSTDNAPELIYFWWTGGIRAWALIYEAGWPVRERSRWILEESTTKAGAVRGLNVEI